MTQDLHPPRTEAREGSRHPPAPCHLVLETRCYACCATPAHRRDQANEGATSATRSTKRSEVAWQSLNEVPERGDTSRRELKRVQATAGKSWATIAVSACVPHMLASVTSFTLQPWFAPDVAQTEQGAHEYALIARPVGCTFGTAVSVHHTSASAGRDMILC